MDEHGVARILLKEGMVECHCGNRERPTDMKHLREHDCEPSAQELRRLFDRETALTELVWGAEELGEYESLGDAARAAESDEIDSEFAAYGASFWTAQEIFDMEPQMVKEVFEMMRDRLMEFASEEHAILANISFQIAIRGDLEQR